MKTTYVERYNKKLLFKKETPTHDKTVTQNTPTPFPPSSKLPDCEPQFIDLHYQQDPYWNDDLYDQEKLERKNNLGKPPEQIEEMT